MKDIKNAKFYIGCVDCEITEIDGTELSKLFEPQTYFILTEYEHSQQGIKLLLRPLSDMTEEEEKEITEIGETTISYAWTGGLRCNTEVFVWFTSKGFDLGLIPDENVKLISKN